jgi:cell division protein ZapE
MTTPLERYEEDLARHHFTVDARQKEVVLCTQQLYDDLIRSVRLHHSQLASLRERFLQRKKNKPRGLYVWGGVGRGKTHLIDNFYECLPFQEKTRMHFHRFMQFIHHELKNLAQRQNPLNIVAARLAKQARVLCLDEFYVSDITDAMLLSGLLKALFDEKVILVTTSNVAPDNLYQNGLQRERFLPAIDLIKQHTEVIHVDGTVDYRSQFLEKKDIYHYPLNEDTHHYLEECFERLAGAASIASDTLEIHHRLIPTIRHAPGIIWFDFQALCNIPRAVADYIELAKRFNTVIISNIHSMGEVDNDKALRLINLVDEFYDRNVKLILSAQVPCNFLYTGERLALQSQRMLSRLREMRSQAYLERPHLP